MTSSRADTTEDERLGGGPENDAANPATSYSGSLEKPRGNDGVKPQQALHSDAAAKLRCISMDVMGGEPAGIVWGEPPTTRLDPKHIGELVCSYLEEMEDGDEEEIVFRRHDMTKEALDALPEI